MKKNVKILLSSIVLLLFSIIIYSTYAIYKTSKTAIVSKKAADWVVKVNNDDIVSDYLYVFDSTDITWDNSYSSAKTGTIAPGSEATISLVIDATGTEVPVEYSVRIGNITEINNNDSEEEPGISENNNESESGSNPEHADIENLITLSPGSGYSLTGIIPLNSSSMTKTVILKLTWNDLNTDISNTNDIYYNNYRLLIPIVVTVKQHLNSN